MKYDSSDKAKNYVARDTCERDLFFPASSPTWEKVSGESTGPLCRLCYLPVVLFLWYYRYLQMGFVQRMLQGNIVSVIITNRIKVIPALNSYPNNALIIL